MGDFPVGSALWKPELLLLKDYTKWALTGDNRNICQDALVVSLGVVMVILFFCS